ncbi:MAG: IPTL-CTERM sorting domain-containing protein [Candidatus Contendobacter sp.]|nr:IPTL-CTERM sorting domain-containing protein [Candidatus Contendobacter sp.]
MKYLRKFLTLELVLLLIITLPTPAMALTITPVNASPGSTLLAALLAPGSGITVVPGSLQFVGRTTGGLEQSATYTGFNLAPSGGGGATVTNPNGILLTSGHANMPNTNTTNSFSNALSQPGTGSNPDLAALAGKSSFDQNFISFKFTVSSGNAVSAKFVFGSDEYPTQSVTDIFGFFVDGKNYAFFPGGALVSNIPEANFQDNPVGSGRYATEYNGITVSLLVNGLLDTALTEHTILIAISDTNDSIFDSGVFIGDLKSTTTTGGGGIGGGDNATANIPTLQEWALLLMGLLLGGLVWRQSQRNGRMSA